MSSPFDKTTNTFIERDDAGRWCVCGLIDGERRVISRHGSEEAAVQARDQLPATAELNVRPAAFGTTQGEADHPISRTGEAPN